MFRFRCYFVFFVIFRHAHHAISWYFAFTFAHAHNTSYFFFFFWSVRTCLNNVHKRLWLLAAIYACMHNMLKCYFKCQLNCILFLLAFSQTRIVPLFFNESWNSDFAFGSSISTELLIISIIIYFCKNVCVCEIVEKNQVSLIWRYLYMQQKAMNAICSNRIFFQIIVFYNNCNNNFYFINNLIPINILKYFDYYSLPSTIKFNLKNRKNVN